MKSFFNFLRKNKLYTIVEIVGMSIALAFVIYISTYVSEQLTRDSEIKGQIAYGVGVLPHYLTLEKIHILKFIFLLLLKLQ